MSRNLIPYHYISPKLTKGELRNLARKGGWMGHVGMKAGQRVENPYWAQHLKNGSLLRRRALRENMLVRLVAEFRPDVVQPGDDSKPWDGVGFNPAWVVGEPCDQFLATWEPWAEAGWNLEITEWWPDGLWQEIVQALPSGQAPVMYPRYRESDKTVTVHQVALDVRIQACRDWLQDEISHLARGAGADAVALGLKMATWRHPQLRRATPTNLADPGGAFQDTPFGPGEWEEAYDALIRDLYQNDVMVMLSHDVGPEKVDDKWEWMNGKPDLRDLLLGEQGSSG